MDARTVFGQNRIEASCGRVHCRKQESLRSRLAQGVYASANLGVTAFLGLAKPLFFGAEGRSGRILMSLHMRSIDHYSVGQIRVPGGYHPEQFSPQSAPADAAEPTPHAIPFSIPFGQLVQIEPVHKIHLIPSSFPSRSLNFLPRILVQYRVLYVSLIF
ncbi:MAG: hypothetical protein O3C43_16580 [Verrucomicrobia bacterium]|nr:hypothetical protein [Verrucomicrobiota bacterium]MDA1068107.1 hypothetical protein [Verrucomicrobiota bacterium]